MTATDFGQLLKGHPEMLDDGKKFLAILRDVYPTERPNVNQMNIAFEAGVVPMLRKNNLDSLLTARIMSVLMDDYSIAEARALWLAELWIDAYSYFTTGMIPIKTTSPAPETVTPSRMAETLPPKATIPSEKAKKKKPKVAETQPAQSSAPTHVRATISNCSSITIPGGVARIGDRAFEGRTNLTSITIPNSVTEIGNWAFKGCIGLTSITIPNSVTGIGVGTFQNCRGLTSITIPDSVTYIGYDAFACCTGLRSITIPDSVMKIGYNAFACCTGLRSITIPDSVMKIGYNAFARCTGLRSITIPDSVTKIEAWAFHDCTGLTSITIPNSVTRIGEHAFDGCSRLTSITIPNSVKEIGECAFEGCKGLKSITIPSSVKKIGWNALKRRPKLTIYTYKGSVAEKYAQKDHISFKILEQSNNTSIKSPSESKTLPPVQSSISKSFTVTELKAGGLMLQRYTGPNSGQIKIPAEINGNQVTRIGNGAFSKCTGLTGITLPDGVTKIGKWAFNKCTSLSDITIPQGVVEIDDDAFPQCPKLTIHAPAGSRVEQYARENRIPFQIL